jgi:hypothetical protein
MPNAWRFGFPGSMPTAAVTAFNSFIHTIASQSESSWAIFELFKAKFSGGCSTSSSESWAISDLQDLYAVEVANSLTMREHDSQCLHAATYTRRGATLPASQ